MKTLLLASLLLSTSVFAAPVATITTGGGYTMRPTTSTVSIEANGTVTLETITGSYEPNVKPEVKNVKIAKLNPAIVAAIVKDIAEANNTNVVAEDPEAPECMDAPGTTFSVIKDGSLTEIARRDNCKDYALADYQGRSALRILQSLLTLSRSI